MIPDLDYYKDSENGNVEKILRIFWASSGMKTSHALEDQPCPSRERRLWVSFLISSGVSGGLKWIGGEPSRRN